MLGLLQFWNSGMHTTSFRFQRFQLNRSSGYLFLPMKIEVLKFDTVLFSVYFVSVHSLIMFTD